MISEVMHKMELIPWNVFLNEWAKGYGSDEMVLFSSKKIVTTPEI
jgi:hypothetical protein